MRFVILAGVPKSIIYSFYPKIIPDILEERKNMEPIWSPLSLGSLGYQYNQAYIEVLRRKLYTAIKAVVGTTNIHDRKEMSVLLLYVEHDTQSTSLLLQEFMPLVLSGACPVDNIHKADCGPNSQRERVANSLVKSMGKHIRNADKIQPALARELVNNESRTPLLLPPKNFNNADLLGTLRDSSRLENYDPKEPDLSVQRLKKVMEKSVVFQRPPGGRKKCFHDNRGVAFKSPGSDRHGIAWLRELNELRPHNPNCVMGARIRLGAAFDPQFHYDCVAATKGLPKDWVGCHNQPERLAKGRVHINVAPNDNVR